MKRKNATRSALFTSVISLLVCVAMLVGTTFAWFTDEVVSGQNIIQAGNLDIDVLYASAPNGTYTTIENKTDLFVAPAGETKGLWEPGHTEVAYLKVVNKGTLALKYQFRLDAATETTGLNADGEVIRLSEILKFAATTPSPTAPDAYTRATAQAAAAASTANLLGYTTQTITLEPNAEQYIALVVYMPESIGNEANYRGTDVPTIDFKLTALATQLEAENDSFGKDYDAGALLPVVYTVEELRNAIKYGGSFKVEGTMDGDETSLVYGDAYPNDTAEYILGANDTSLTGGNYVLDTGAKYGIMVYPNNKTVTLSNAVIDSSLQWSVAADFENGGALIIKDTEIEASKGAGIYAWYEGDITLDNVKVNHLTLDPAYATTTPWAATAVAASDGVNMTINSGTYAGTTNGVYVYNSGATVTINGGTFKAPAVLKGDGNYSDGDAAAVATIIVNDGTFDGRIEANNGNALITINGGNFTNFAFNNGGWNTRGILVVKGGTFDADPSAYVAEGYTAVDNSDGTYTVLPTGMKTVAGYSRLYTDGTDFYVYDAQGLISLNNYFAGNRMNNSVWSRNYKIMADIDAAGYTWNNVYMVTGTGEAEGINLLGNSHTISNLTIAGGGMLGGTPNCTNSTNPAYVKNLTFDNVTVTGNAHFAGVVWGGAATCGDVYFEDVHIVNSSVTGNCNVGALIGATGEQSATYDLTITFKDCSVENTTLVANGNPGADPTGASAFIGRAYANTSLVFEGENVAKNNTITNNDLVGGGIYGYTVWAGSGFTGTGVCDTFTNWDGLVAATNAEDLRNAMANGGNIALAGTVDLGGGRGAFLTPTGDVTISGGTIKGVGNDGELNSGVKAQSGNIVFDGVTFELTNEDIKTGSWGMSVNISGTANVTFKNCEFKGEQCPIYQSGADCVVTFENCKFDTTSVAIQCEIYTGDFQLGQDLIVKNCDFTGVANVLHIYDYDKDPSSEAIAQYLKDNGNIFTGNCIQTCK